MVKKQKAERPKGKAKGKAVAGHGSIRRQLNLLGLEMKMIEADGNCFFRSLADQIEGDESLHMEYRNKVMAHIEENSELYRFFLEDDEDWDKYVKRMKKDGAWAGNIELTVASQVLESSIAIHQQGQPLWIIAYEGPKKPHRWLHLAYLNESHYNSVRLEGETEGPAAFPDLDSLQRAAAARATGDGSMSSLRTDDLSGPIFPDEDIEWVMMCTGCVDRDEAIEALRLGGGNRNDAVESIIAKMCNDDDTAAAKAGRVKAGRGAAEEEKSDPCGAARERVAEGSGREGEGEGEGETGGATHVPRPASPPSASASLRSLPSLDSVSDTAATAGQSEASASVSGRASQCATPSDKDPDFSFSREGSVQGRPGRGSASAGDLPSLFGGSRGDASLGRICVGASVKRLGSPGPGRGGGGGAGEGAAPLGDTSLSDNAVPVPGALEGLEAPAGAAASAPRAAAASSSVEEVIVIDGTDSDGSGPDEGLGGPAPNGAEGGTASGSASQKSAKKGAVKGKKLTKQQKKEEKRRARAAEARSKAVESRGPSSAAELLIAKQLMAIHI